MAKLPLLELIEINLGSSKSEYRSQLNNNGLNVNFFVNCNLCSFLAALDISCFNCQFHNDSRIGSFPLQVSAL